MAKKVSKVSVKQNKATPWVQVAAFAERVLREPDGVISLIRIVDQITVKSDKDTLPAGTLMMKPAVILKSGNALGNREITLMARDPNGKKICAIESRATFEGGETGILVSEDMPLPIKMTGLYVVDVTVGSKLITKMPLRIDYKKSPQLTAQPPNKPVAEKKKTRKKPS
jgi:hypothetical protein